MAIEPVGYRALAAAQQPAVTADVTADLPPLDPSNQFMAAVEPGAASFALHVWNARTDGGFATQILTLTIRASWGTVRYSLERAQAQALAASLHTTADGMSSIVIADAMPRPGGPAY